MKENELIFGTRAVIEAIAAGKEIDKILVRRDLQSELARELFTIVKDTNIHVQRVPKERLDRITRKNHQGIIAFMAAVAYQHLDDIVPFLFEEGKTPLIVLLDGITDVRNFGAIARTCECGGIDAIVIPAHNSVSVTADAVKTSAGALMNIPVCKESSIIDAVRYLKNCGYKIIAATEKAKNIYTSADMTVPAAIILGGEDTGISADILKICDELVMIPIFGKIASLNVSVAASIMIYEAIRQRKIMVND
ncbi:MAG: 23S rRNA (guanosine(2251)-2'-O)-methyltransferase RlmB [Dysgonamonadaceae bacterium]|jgi:23S rRNA (guanosine2251-2'-O)-methyltransferase|nr:23S rRNA (guanosine(2251)-2'-O)-methyltransferase RlmB [Dysgonamonadaceae bacterium]